MLAGLLLMFQTAVVVTPSVDREEVPVGEEFVYTIKARSSRGGQFRLQLTPCDRAREVDRVESTEPSGAGLSYEFQLTLKAIEPGPCRFTAVSLFFGGTEYRVSPITVSLLGGSPERARNPRLVDLIRAVPTPSPSTSASIMTVVSSSRVYHGQQLELITAAWFSRSLRMRLRQAPTLRPPMLAGAWITPQASPAGAVSTRVIGDETFDLFVTYHVVFPLTPGTLVIPPASLEYLTPDPRRSGTRTWEIASDPVMVEVLPLPDGKPVGFRGPTARNVRIEYRVPNLPAKAGELFAVDVRVSGRGNLTFWPPPTPEWPVGARAYLDRTTEDPDAIAGELGGVKTFHFILLADSVGSMALPELTYSYFDPIRREYRVSTSLGKVIPVVPFGTVTMKRDRLPLEPNAVGFQWTDWLAPLTLYWWLAFFAPIVPFLLIAVIPSLRRRRAKPPAKVDGVIGIERLVTHLVPEADRGHAEKLAQSLRRAGMPEPLAVEATAVKQELDRVRFAEIDGTVSAPLRLRAVTVLRKIPEPVRRRAGIVVALVAMLTSNAGNAQNDQSPEQAFAAGDFGTAAAGFLAEADARPYRADLRYNTALAHYLSGNDAEATANLIAALERDPRSELGRSLWTTLERHNEPLRQIRPRRWTWNELSVLAIALWWVAVIVFFTANRSKGIRFVLVAVAIAGLVMTAAGGPTGDRAIARSGAVLRDAPSGLATERGRLPELSQVRVTATRGNWILVSDRLGNQGWIISSSLVRIPR